MSNFEHRITEDSTEFEKAFLKIYDGNMWAALEKMKDWQPPKPREIPVEIPQFVACWFEEKMGVAFSEVVSAYSFSGNEAIAWVYENGGIDLLCKMKLYGYTIEKEQLYEVVFAVNEDGDRYLLLESDGFFIDNESMNEGYYKQQFTEAEIKDIDERYWAFAVPVDEV